MVSLNRILFYALCNNTHMSLYNMYIITCDPSSKIVFYESFRLFALTLFDGNRNRIPCIQ